MVQVRHIIVVALFSLLLAACGARGPLEPPPGAKPAPEQDKESVLDNLI